MLVCINAYILLAVMKLVRPISRLKYVSLSGFVEFTNDPYVRGYQSFALFKRKRGGRRLRGSADHSFVSPQSRP